MSEEKLGLPRGGKHELPLLIQDRNLALDDDNQFTGAMLHKLASDGAEFYGPYTVVDGKIWPYARVEPRQVRLRLLNGSNGRFYRLKLKDDRGVTSTAKFRQIGTDSGLLDGPVDVPPEGLTLAPAERADVILDLKDYAGKSVSLVNDYPIPMIPTPPETQNVPNKPIHEEVIQFRVAARCTTPDTLHLPESFVPQFFKSARRNKSEAKLRRPIYLIEDPPGTLTINGRLFHDRIEEVVHLGDTEIWEFVNTTGDFHPIHLHLVDFEVIERQQFQFADGLNVDQWVRLFRLWQAADPSVQPPAPPGLDFTGDTCKIDANEQGLKDTIRAGPMTVTRILVNFGPHTGRYVYHCHILEHEDMEMMRPFMVLPEDFDLMGPNTGPGTIPLTAGGRTLGPHMVTPGPSACSTSLTWPRETPTWQFSTLPSRPHHCRCPPTEAPPFLGKPEGSMTGTASGGADVAGDLAVLLVDGRAVVPGHLADEPPDRLRGVGVKRCWCQEVLVSGFFLVFRGRKTKNRG